MRDPVEECGSLPVYTVTTNEALNRIEMRSDCCYWAIDWYPDEWNTCIDIWAVMANDGATHNPNPYTGQLTG